MTMLSEFQEMTRPELEDILQGYGQLVTIQRPGQSETQTQAFLYQLTDKQASGTPVERPIWHVTAWQGVFKHDAPVHGVGFIVIDRTGRAFVPEADAENPGMADVLQLVRLNPLVERTRLTTLAFNGQGSELVKDPATGNRHPALGASVVVQARLSHTNDPHVVQLVGADSSSTAIIGRWGTLTEPTGTPPGVLYGSQCLLTVDGQPGWLTIMLAWPDEDLKTEQQFGARWVGVWKVK